MRLSWTAADLSPLALAYVGDAIWELYARNHVLAGGIRKPNELHKAATRYVRASAQARLADQLGAILSAEELTILRRGRNAKAGHMRKSTDVLTYRHSTGFEALLGYLYGTGQQERLDEVCETALRWIDEWEDAGDAEKRKKDAP
ncbi:ribonuclease III [Alicyclobacillus cycloheptanicus]|uniref:Mini-ribonuclease 3 n=1 Tax=Alicyclobacillus cycloheptanicus TaxID=1457 RepID=A0ABT9XK17_9BACL|nr:ribonuclease III domain-containing protein [Alicyclobacillus cycloheptanicus]MDQ0190384.1 ribonuclease-3 family protein [Alicyclobacillus cycloheptanicus]WDM02627.1 ribonuclease III [Alicyclobacillus cycloheptanicus]